MAEVDAKARLVVVRAAQAGPAGTAGLQLGEDLELDIDVTAPSTLVGVILHLPSDGAPDTVSPVARRRLQPLLGTTRVQALMELVRAAVRDGTQLWRGRLDDGFASWRARHGGEGRAADSAMRNADARVAATLSRAALAYQAASEVGALPLLRASGLLEAAVELAQPGIPGLGSIARRDARRGAHLLLELVEDARLVVPDRAAPRLAALLRSVTGLDERGSRGVALAALADAVERGEHTGPSRGDPTHHRSAADAAAVHDATPAGPFVTVDVRALPGALAATPLVAYHTRNAELQVRVPAWAERHHGLWARAFRANDDVLLAVAPLRRQGPDAIARLLVPNAMKRLEVDVTDRPELPRPSAALSAVQRAIYHGGLAARAERLGSPTQAAEHWRRCAGGWLSAGDRARVQQASLCARAVRAGPRPPHRVIAPLVSDLVRS